MREDWKKTPWLFSVGCVALIVSMFGASTVNGQTTTAFETVHSPLNSEIVIGVRDPETGLVWGSDIEVWTLLFYVENDVPNWAARQNNRDEQTGEPDPNSLAGGYDDWRPPTVAEVVDAIGRGLLDYIDFSYYEDGRQGVDSPVPHDVERPYLEEGKTYTDGFYDPNADPPVTYGDKWYFTACTVKQGGRIYRYEIQFNNNAPHTLDLMQTTIIPVRGAPPNHDGDPKFKGSDIPDIPGHTKPPKPPKK